MARPTKAEQAAKLKAKGEKSDPGTIQTVKNEPPANEGIKIVNVASDNDVLQKLDLQLKADEVKVKSIPQPVFIPNVTNMNLPKGMVAYWDTKLNKQGSDKESIVKGMVRFNPGRFKLQ